MNRAAGESPIPEKTVEFTSNSGVIDPSNRPSPRSSPMRSKTRPSRNLGFPEIFSSMVRRNSGLSLLSVTLAFLSSGCDHAEESLY